MLHELCVTQWLSEGLRTETRPWLQPWQCPGNEALWGNSPVFPKLYKVGNVANKGLQWQEQKKFNQKMSPVGIEPRTCW